MRKLLTCSTALSVALTHAPMMPAHAQTLAEDGSVLGPDGAVLCVPSADVPCDLEAITRALQEAAAAAEASAAAEAEAARIAAEEEAARLAAEAAAAAAAEAEAASAAAAEEAARVEAEEAAAQAAAEEAARLAAEEAAAQAAADEAARVAAEAAAAQAAADEAARVAAEQEAARVAAEEEAARLAAEEEAARLAAEAAATQPGSETAGTAEPEPLPEVMPEATPEVAAEASDPEATAPEAVEPDVAETAPAAEPTVLPEEGSAPTEAAETTEITPPEITPPDAEVAAEADPAEGLATGEAVVTAEPVDAPEVSEEAASSLASILAAPTVTEEAAAPEVATEGEAVAEGEAAPVAEPALPVAATATLSTSDAAPGSEPSSETATETPPADPAAAPVAVVTEVISDDSTRSSDQEFAAAPVAVAGGKKSGLSDLEKVGLLALGALVVGAVINEGKKDEKKVVSNSGDRVVVQNPDGSYVVYKDDDAVLRRPGVQTTTETYRDGSTRTVVSRADGTQVVTIRDASGRVLRRATYDRYGQEVILFDDLYPEERIDITKLPPPRPDRVTISTSDGDAGLKAELAALEAESLGRKFSLRQIREISEVRALAATIEVDSITFDTGSAAIKATEARKLADIGRLIQELLAANPAEVFLIEGHTDAVGSAASNLSLSDRRAESMALALTEYFDIPPENLVVQGYGESELKIDTDADERANRRVVVRLITPLMRTASLR